MNLLILGRGKTGSLVADIARQRRHRVRVAGSADNTARAALSSDLLREIDVVIDFTTPACVLPNIEACVRAGKNMVVGTTGWYTELPRVRDMVRKQGTGFLFAANFSVGVNIFLDIARSAAEALKHDYSGQIFERHYAQKKDAPSGTAIAIRNTIVDATRGGNKVEGGKNQEIEIVSFREGEVVGMHEIILESAADRIYLCHDAKSRRGFAEGAVRAAEWIIGKKGFYDFKDMWREL